MNFFSRLDKLRNRIFEKSNEHCFIERESFLNAYKDNSAQDPEYYAKLFADMLDSVSTPIFEEDFFAGRVVEGEPIKGVVAPCRKIFGKGHLTPDYAKLLKYGYKGILETVFANAEKIGTEQAKFYAKNSKTVVHAIKRFANRYANASKEVGNLRAFEALQKVPFEPAWDLYSALSAIWLVHMVASAYVGARDYGFGYMDEYLYPYYLAEKQKGTTDREIVFMLAGFFIKTNEICGRTAHNYNRKPVLCHSAKQYVLLDGGKANDFTCLILEACKILDTAQPEFTVVLSEKSSEDFNQKVFETMSVAKDRLQVYNCELVQGFLKSKNLPQSIIDRPAFTACCTPDIYLHSVREEYYLPTVQIFTNVLHENKFNNKIELLLAFKQAVKEESEKYIETSREVGYTRASQVYLLDGLLLSDCNEVCKYPPYGLTYRAKNIFLPGIATLADSLYTIDKLVFNGKIGYNELISALKDDFIGHEDLLAQIKSLDKFGNDTEVDDYATEIGNVMIDAVEQSAHANNEILIPSFYSLERDNSWASEILATPDGRKKGTPISENQSPTYGNDKSGLTALLNSLAKIPFNRTGGGGLNLTFSAEVNPSILGALIKTYFKKGGIHCGITVLNRETLQDAMVNPDKYKSLTVRLYGFSEYFICLPKFQQLAVLNRTVY